MSIHIALHHRTHYHYDRPVELGPQTVRLRPAPHCRTRILSYSLRVLPEPHFINWQQDPQSNYLARLVFPEKTREFCVEVDLVAEMSVLNPFDFFLEPAAERFPFHYDGTLDHELEPFQLKCELSPKLQAYLASVTRDALGENITFLNRPRESVPHSEVAEDVHAHGHMPEVGQRQCHRAVKTGQGGADENRPL